MKMTIGQNMISLEGDWTLKGMTFKNVTSVTDSLKQVSFGCVKKLLIDCREISSVDACGLQFLHIWLKWFNCRGFKTELVNLSICLENNRVAEVS